MKLVYKYQSYNGYEKTVYIHNFKWWPYFAIVTKPFIGIAKKEKEGYLMRIKDEFYVIPERK